MYIKKNNFKRVYLAIAFFLAFSGSYVIILTMINIGLRDISRMLTIPMRLLIVGCLGITFLIERRFKYQDGLICFILFMLFYYFRIYLEMVQHNMLFHIPVSEFFLYFTSFVVLPLLFLSQLRLDHKDYSLLLYTIIFGCLLLSISAFSYYHNLIGEVTRLTSGASESGISPLILSYTSALGIGVGVSYLYTNNKVKKGIKIVIYVTILFCLIPFFLGASRGAMLALITPFVFYAFFVKGIKKKTNAISILIMLAVLLLIAAEYLGMGVFNRFMNIGEDIASGSSSAARLEMWKSGIYQFLENPLLGNSLEVSSSDMYPHNILIEALITTGLLGFVCYILFLFYVIKKSIWILKNNPSNFFIVVIFMQALTKNMFSGGIYSTSWLAISAGLILGYDKLGFTKTS